MLERAATDIVDRYYSRVTSQENLVGSRRPRLVKLHGSLPDRIPFIITKEHYRQYPQTHPAFVNTVQQAAMECSLCLLGFGGNDPNFLAWAGWVRDNLGNSAPPIYLVGVLDLNSRSRSQLERQYIIPIDLGPTFSKVDYSDNSFRHRIANEWFLLNLAHGDPDPMMWPWIRDQEASSLREFSEWNIPLLSKYSQPSAISKREELTLIISNYPGWIICPLEKKLAYHIVMELYEKAFPKEEYEDEMEHLIAWEYGVTSLQFFGLTLGLKNLRSLQELLEKTSDVTDQWGELAIHVLTGLRWESQWDEYDKWKETLENHQNLTSKQRARVHHESAWAALDRLDYETLERLLSKWPDISGDSRSRLSRAALMVEVCDFEGATRIVKDVLKEIRTQTSEDRVNIRSMAIEGVAMTFLNLLKLEIDEKQETTANPQGRMAELSRYHCNPTTYFESEKTQLIETPSPNIQQKKMFDLHSVQTIQKWGTSEFDEHRDSALRALRLFEIFGLPMICGVGTYFRSMAIRAASIVADVCPDRAFAVILRLADLNALDAIYTQLYVARLENKSIKDIISMGRRVINYLIGRKQKGLIYKTDKKKLAIVFDLLSRLSNRMDQETLETLFNIALDQAKSDKLSKTSAVHTCIERIFLVSDAQTRIKFLEQLIQLPINPINPFTSSRIQSNASNDPIVSLSALLPTGSNQTSSRLSESINVLLAQAASNNAGHRLPALFRLKALFDSGNLNDTQSKHFGELLWTERCLDRDGLPVGFLEFYRPATLLELPGCIPQDLAPKLRKKLIHDLFQSANEMLRSVKMELAEASVDKFEVLSHFLHKRK